jgi:hypothetical protein
MKSCAKADLSDVKGLMTMLNAGVAILVIAALSGLVFGDRYPSARSFMPYQATAANKVP